MSMWEPPTKQFYPKCQSPRVLPSSQSTWSIAAPICIGSRPTSRQSIRDRQTKHHSQCVIEQLYSVERQATTTSQPASQLTTERSCRVMAIRTNRSAHHPALHSVQSNDWPSRGQREHSVRVHVTTSSSSSHPKQRQTSRGQREHSVCVRFHKHNRGAT
jgi:hypothetical protein